MDNFTMITIICFIINLIAVVFGSFFIILFETKRKELIKDYKQLLILKDWYEKISEEATRSYIIESVEKRGYGVINQLDKLNSNFIEIQEKQKNYRKSNRSFIVIY